MAVDILKLFNHDLPDAMKREPEQALEIGAVFQMNVSGPEGGQWTIDCKKGSGPRCVPGTDPKAELTLEIADTDFRTLAQNPQANGMPLFVAGKLRLSGNQMLALKLQKLFDLIDD